MGTSNCDGQPRRTWVAWEVVPSVLKNLVLEEPVRCPRGGQVRDADG